jgi:hypothetical protein
VILIEAGRTEHRDAWLGEIETFKTAQEFEEKLYSALEVRRAAAAPSQKQLFGTFYLVEQ